MAVMAPSTIHVSSSFARPRRSSVTVAPAPGDLRRSLCDQGQEPRRLVEGTAGCHGHGVFDRTVLFGERMSEARVTPSAG